MPDDARMKTNKNASARLGLPALLAVLSSPSLACTQVPFCEALPGQCLADEETGDVVADEETDGVGESGDGAGGSETGPVGETEETSGLGDDMDSEETSSSEEDTGPLLACGDGEVQDGEECDDGNVVDGDGCDNDCTFTSVAALSLGDYHSCALIDGGRVRCWGQNDNGQLGLGHTSNIGNSKLPSDAGDLLLPAPPTAISLGGDHTCALFDDGDVGCWGRNYWGQLGNGGSGNYGDNETLANLEGLGLSSVIDVQLGNFHTCALLDDGTVTCWGWNIYGQLGYGNFSQLTSPGGSLSLGGKAVKLAAGADHTCALLENHDVRCWGNNVYGQLGLGDIGNNELPTDADPVSLGLPPDTEVVDLELGGNHTCALLSDGSVMCWGDNTHGQLGLGHTNDIGDDELPSDVNPVSLPDTVEQLALGAYHTCALLTGGKVMCWGRNDYGQLGLGHTNNIGDDELPTDGGFVNLGGSTIAIAAGDRHTCALLENHDVRCWGRNLWGQLGLGHHNDIGDDELPSSASPVSVF
ncbi:hypothetical protein G6O69_29570 [Pseudenhygromyxa sp. WMMC2535]|uniref:RCC1 domain-containing protein n=1 Tax=Pseudenhygromyxa sp. WMMC2535 TaxID=2712867 RepID=UPI001552E363|nr:hypothetical protein [Pseudenhygromyxa sp. WMMC2535]NVB42012.1 hypothetical protein [Pseudenhygromyxa sp. WMMC2535]